VLEIAFRTPGRLLGVAGVNTTEVFTKTSMLTIAGINGVADSGISHVSVSLSRRS